MTRTLWYCIPARCGGRFGVGIPPESNAWPKVIPAIRRAISIIMVGILMANTIHNFVFKGNATISSAGPLRVSLRAFKLTAFLAQDSTNWDSRFRV